MTTSTAAGAATTAPVAASAAQKAQIQLRVRADLIDSQVNEAGEVAIARARIEGEMRALKTSLLELTDNVIRLRHQVREIEIQAETQMASQITELKAQAEIEGRAFDPLEFDRFTRFQELTRMMAESVNDVTTVQHTLLSNVTNADASLSAQARINRELGTTAVVITHTAAIAGMADRVIHLGDGRIQRVEHNEHKISPAELSW